eukprot:CAMPEP_0119370718 /NCGR_PEP_ID=MMETSP1334-20130426/17036_1 /TAXON_ID=127549 /ORGANISM="Calcidiscus leptoporus, Strain RCC1130" /LENGTH=55 /DNA_ID=CAMNT_0007387835 /DNA_START=55 /DNA_END=219 /DNA_ORIENTATION=+
MGVAESRANKYYPHALAHHCEALTRGQREGAWERKGDNGETLSAKGLVGRHISQV